MFDGLEISVAILATFVGIILFLMGFFLGAVIY